MFANRIVMSMNNGARSSEQAERSLKGFFADAEGKTNE